MKRLFSRLDEHGRQSLILMCHNGLFWFAWSIGCYQTVYLQGAGFSASQLGLLNAVSSGVAIASLAFWGMVSDRIGSLKKVLITVLLGGCALYALVPLIPANLPLSPLLLTVFLPAVNFLRGSQTTFAENILVRNCNEIRLNYGALRSMGSLLFTAGSWIIAAALPFLGVQNTFWLVGAAMLPVVVLTFFAREPNARKRSPKKDKKEQGESLSPAALFKNRSYVMLLLFALFFYIGTSCEGTFIPYFMKEVGVPSEQYGIVLGFRALPEIPCLLLMAKLRRRFPLRNLVAASAVLFAVECLGMGLFARSLPMMLFCCVFMGLGNGLFIGSSLNYVYELAPDGLKASAQAFYASTSSVAGILGNLLGGRVFDLIGATSFYMAIACVFLLSSLVFVLSFIGKKNRERA